MATYVIEIDENTTVGKKVLSQLKSLNVKIRKESDLTVLPMSVSELNKRIDHSEDDFRNGRYKTNSELIAKYK